MQSAMATNVFLQRLTHIAAEKYSSIIFPFPIEMLKIKEYIFVKIKILGLAYITSKIKRSFYQN